MYRSLFARDVFAELDRLQREVSTLFDYSPSIRGGGRAGFPALNVGSTDGSVEVYAFVPSARRCISMNDSPVASAAWSACPTTSIPMR